MGDFFKGWRRKVGVVTLAMALVFMGGWVRSLTTNDAISFHSGTHTTESLQSVNCVIVWQRRQYAAAKYTITIPDWTTCKFSTEERWFDDTGMVWRWQFWGFGFGELPSDLVEGVQARYFFTPYWFVTITLTLVSLWLLLSKPRGLSSKKPPETIQCEGA